MSERDKLVKTVKFLKTVQDGQVECGRVIFDDREVKFKGLEDHFIKSLKHGILGRYGKRYNPSDGIEFLENLKYEFTGSYLRATDVLDE